MLKLNLRSVRYKLATKPSLRNIDFSVREGDFVWITGESGAGKTTLLRVAAGLIPSWFSGEVVGDAELGSATLVNFDKNKLRHLIGYVSEDPMDQLSYVTSTVEQEVSLALYPLGISTLEISRRVEEALHVCGLMSVRDRQPNELSGGMKCRLVLAGEIAKRPKLYLIDEGLGHIDRGALKNFLDFLLGEAKRGVPVIVVSNDLTMGSLFANRIVLMENGTIKFEGDIQSALSDPGVIRATGGNKILNSFMTFHENNRGRKPLSLSELRELIKSETNSDPV